MKPLCPRCNNVHPSNAARAVHLFAHTPQSYRSALGGPLRGSRAEAEADWCESAASWHVDYHAPVLPAPT